MTVLALHRPLRRRSAVGPEVLAEVVRHIVASPCLALAARMVCSRAEAQSTGEAHRRRCIVAGVQRRGRQVVVGRAGRGDGRVVVGRRR